LQSFFTSAPAVKRIQLHPVFSYMNNVLPVVYKFSWGQRAERMEIWGRYPPSQGFHSICKWMKPVFWLGCCGCIFHGTGNSAQLWQNFGISGGFEPLKPYSVCQCVLHPYSI
jgi:hypothetical protein